MLHKKLSNLAGIVIIYFIMATLSILGAAQVASAASQSSIQSYLPVGVQLHYSSRLSSIYTSNKMQPLWRDQSAVEHFQQQLIEVALAGVNPQFSDWVQALVGTKPHGMARDIILSDALLGYLNFEAGVRANNGAWLYSIGDYAYKMGEAPSEKVQQWQQSVRNGKLLSFINGLRPSHPLYTEMSKSVKQQLLIDSRDWPIMGSGPTLRAGDVSANIPALRDILLRMGMISQQEAKVPDNLNSDLASQTADGSSTSVQMVSGGMAKTSVALTTTPETASTALNAVGENSQSMRAGTNVRIIELPLAPANYINLEHIYTKGLVEGVKRFQHWQGLNSDGVIGARTREWLNTKPQKRAAMLALNIQRLRVLPKVMNSGIMVNIPDYSLVYYREDHPVLTSRVIVGQPTRKTPQMRSELTNVVINPPWNVPSTLLREDIIPQAKRNPSYITRKGYKILSGWDNNTREINPNSIHWQGISAENFPYRIQQAPGANNALGRYKFNMPSRDAIYLHDTPNHGLFGRDMRALSSGCVRVDKAVTLANMLLTNAGWTNDRIASALKEGSSRYVPLSQHVPVRLYYLTAWVDDMGKQQFRSDIYGYDSNIATGGKELSQARILLSSSI